MSESSRGHLPPPRFLSDPVPEWADQAADRVPRRYLATPRADDAGLRPGAFIYELANLGQQPFVPFNVGGWGQNQYWLSTSASNGQLALAWAVAQYADLAAVADLNGNPGAQVDAITKMLAIQSWSPRTYQALWKLADKGTPQEVLVLALVSPEYLMN